jgi:deoxyribodipyrimidine photolyase-related protein
MSNYCKGCHYNPKERIGEGACPFNALYWDFFDRHTETFKNNPRIGMAYRQIDKMSPEQRSAITEQARIWRDNLEKL